MKLFRMTSLAREEGAAARFLTDNVTRTGQKSSSLKVKASRKRESRRDADGVSEANTGAVAIGEADRRRNGLSQS